MLSHHVKHQCVDYVTTSDKYNLGENGLFWLTVSEGRSVGVGRHVQKCEPVGNIFYSNHNIKSDRKTVSMAKKESKDQNLSQKNNNMAPSLFRI